MSTERSLRTALLFFLLLPLLTAGTTYADAQPLVRAAVETPQPVLVGQQARLVVELLVPNFFLSPPQFPALEMPGALVTEAPDRAQNTTQTVDGVDYSGIRKTYLVTPQQPGALASATARIAFRYAAEPGKPGVDGTVDVPTVALAVKATSGGDAASSAQKPVARLTMVQTFDRDTAGLHVGDTLTRTVVTSAEHAQAMLIPAPSFAAPAGVRVYGHDPVLRDVAQDPSGFAGGRRTDRATYLFERAGTVALPAVELQWVDPGTGRSEVASAPGVTIVVTAGPGATAPGAAALAPPATGDRTPWIAWSCVALLVLACAWLARRAGPRLGAWAETRRANRAASEPAAFAALEEACRANEPSDVYRALDLWARRDGFSGPGDLCARRPSLRAAVVDLEGRLFGRTRDPGAWDGEALLAAAREAREVRVTVGRTWLLAEPVVLPPLNP